MLHKIERNISNKHLFFIEDKLMLSGVTYLKTRKASKAYQLGLGNPPKFLKSGFRILADFEIQNPDFNPDINKI